MAPVYRRRHFTNFNVSSRGADICGGDSDAAEVDQGFWHIGMGRNRVVFGRECYPKETRTDCVKSEVKGTAVSVRAEID